MAAMTMLKANGCLNPKYITVNTNVTAPKTSNSVITRIGLPSLRMSSKTNSLPMLKAMMASAISLIMPNESTSSVETNPRNDWPISKPATRYPVTLGSLSIRASFAPTNPASSTIPIRNKTSTMHTPT